MIAITMTVHERLLELGADETQARKAETLLGSLMPHGRAVEITDEVLHAARNGDAFWITCLLAEEVEPEPDELEAMAEDAARRARGEEDELTDAEDLCRELLGEETCAGIFAERRALEQA